MAGYDAIIIGAGHNGLVAAAYLAQAGLKVLSLERRHIVGGAAVSEEFHPGYRNSIASYSLGMLRGEIVRDLDLKRHGLEAIPYKGALDFLGPGKALLLTGDEAHDRAVVGQYSNRDYDAMVRFRAALLRIGDIIRDEWMREPPPLSGGLGVIFDALRVSKTFGKLSVEDRHFLAEIFTSNAHDIVHRWFESPAIRQLYCGYCQSGTYSSMRSAGSALPFFMMVLGELDGVRFKWGMARGGMGSVTKAMAAACRERGVEIRVSAPVSRVLIEAGQAKGVVLESGEEIRAPLVLANTDPKRTFLKLVGKENLEEDFAKDIEHSKTGTATFRMNLALNAAPTFADLPERDWDLARKTIMHLMPELDAMEENFIRAIQGEFSRSPYMVVQIPSSQDDSLAPPGHHVMSVLAKFYPYQLSNGRNWDDHRDEAAEQVIGLLETHFPNLRSIIVGRQIFSPLDLERIFGLSEGDVFHGRHEISQIFSLRPHPKAAQFRTPIKGLYICGAGAHPGGSVSGAPGYNASKRVLKDRRKWL
jgi:phytoene dehydrogenase-like protein